MLFSYNILNLPCGVTSATSGSLTYTYLSDGTKESAVREDGSGKRYVGSMVYSVPASGGGSESLESVAWDEGRIGFTKSGSTYTLMDLWFVKDHLGNVRSVVDVSPGLSSPQVVERNDYLPYGTRLSVGNAVLAANRYRLGGKEEQVFGSLDLGKVDFGARQYDPFTARWTTQDPLAEKYPHLSPYNFCGDNPVNFVDPQGDTIIVSNLGLILSNDYKDNTVMLYQEDGNKYIGTIGGFIDVSDIAPNILLHNSELAKEMNIIDFYYAVKETGPWDLKYNSNTIFGYIWCKEKDEDIKTVFSFSDYGHLTAADFGNYHFGYVGSFVYSGEGIPPYILLKGAGFAEAMKEWRDGNKFISLMRFEQLLDPRSLVSGDRPRDYYWTTQGIKEARRQKKL